MSLRPGAAIAVACLALAGAARAAPACEAEGLEAYAGRYVAAGWSREGYVDVRVREGVLTWGPALWRPARRLSPVASDAFQIETFSERRVHFTRDAQGCVSGMVTENLPFDGPLHRAKGNEPTPFSFLLGGSSREALPGLLQEAGGDVEKLVALGRRMLDVPSQRENARRFAGELTSRVPARASTWILRGDAEVVRGMREAAAKSYRVALVKDPGNERAKRALEILGALEAPAVNTGLPFTLEEMFREPSAAEIARVRAAWSDMDLRPKDVRVEREAEVSLAGAAFTVRLISHASVGGRTYGVILVPKGARSGTLPVLVEAKGVSWNFFPLRVPEGLNLPGILGAHVRKFVLVAPGFRGEDVLLAGESFRSPSAHESWSGAALDLLTLLNVALDTTPEADAARIGAFGRSRGGAVALLAAERDPRIRCVVSWAAPADWFRLMAPEGWTQREAAEDAFRRDARLGEAGGQFLYNFLRFSRDGKESLAAVRTRLIASSPLYFAESLPPTQLHYGVEDAIVPERNGRAIESRLRRWPEVARRVELRYHADAGHDQDLFESPRQSREFLLERLLGVRPEALVP